MAIPKIEGSQRDFSAGELDVTFKRGDDTQMVKAGARQMRNFRILNSRAIANRPGRRALFLEPDPTRVDEVVMAPGVVFKLIFGTGTLKVRDASGAIVFSTSSLAWAFADGVASVVWEVYDKTIYICFQGSPTTPPYTLTWDGVSTWTLGNFAASAGVVGQKRTLFYRLLPKGITMHPSGLVGSIIVDFSAPFLTGAYVGARMRFVGRQLVITGFISATTCSAAVVEALPAGFQMNTAADPRLFINVGDVVIGSQTGAKGYVTATGPGGIVVQLLTSGSSITSVTGATGASTTASGIKVVGADVAGAQASQSSLTPTQQTTTVGFIDGEIISGPGGSVVILPGASNIATLVPQPCPDWDEELMSPLHGYPRSVFVDQNRLGFCDFAAAPGVIAWSAIGTPTDFYVDTVPNAAILEPLPRKSRALFVVPGVESSEFIFCDNGIYYIPISTGSPLVPGSVEYKPLSADNCAHVKPIVAQETILYVTAGLKRVKAISAVGSATRPYQINDLSEQAAHLFTGVKALAAPNAEGSFSENYLYALNSDGSVVVAKYTAVKGQPQGFVGWTPWDGGGSVAWVSALGSDVLFTSNYAPGGAASVCVVEQLDDALPLDALIAVSAPPAAIPTPGGKGPLWWLANGSVDLVDLAGGGVRMMGTYRIDANGFIVPQGNGGENLASATLVAGQTWTAILEPFMPDMQPGGQDVGQRMLKRRVARFAAYVHNSTGFLMARLFSGPLRPGGPALGTVMNQRRVTTWNQDDDPTQPAPLREEVQRWRPAGRAIDPRLAIIKDTPGPLNILEIGMEITV